MPETIRFPEAFLFGAATSAYQIEGSPLADGAGPSIWHRFSHEPGRTSNGDTGDVACDHYRRFRADVGLLAELGASAYRFSIAWARVLPQGTGPVNPAGVGFYDRLVDALLERGIAPCVTLYHWDLPAALDDRGGWLNRDVAAWFADYADVMAGALGDRVALWATLNEPWVIAVAGYLTGAHAPGRSDPGEAALAAHNLLRAHGAGLQALRAAGARQAGLVVNLEPKYPASDAPADLAATRRADAFMNRQFLDPVFFGRYPVELDEIYGAGRFAFPAEDFSLIRQPLDWEVYPPALTDVLSWVRDRYGGVPLYITENGAAFDDPPVTGGGLDDPLRVAYYREHLRAAHRAIELGVDLRGYFAWSLLDNFEWGHGYSKRFGLYHVDFGTQKRTPKSSARFYGEVIRSRGEALGR